MQVLAAVRFEKTHTKERLALEQEQSHMSKSLAEAQGAQAKLRRLNQIRH